MKNGYISMQPYVMTKGTVILSSEYGGVAMNVAEINRVLYDFTPKPTGTVEFE